MGTYIEASVASNNGCHYKGGLTIFQLMTAKKPAYNGTHSKCFPAAQYCTHEQVVTFPFILTNTTTAFVRTIKKTTKKPQNKCAVVLVPKRSNLIRNCAAQLDLIRWSSLPSPWNATPPPRHPASAPQPCQPHPPSQDSHMAELHLPRRTRHQRRPPDGPLPTPCHHHAAAVLPVYFKVGVFIRYPLWTSTCCTKAASSAAPKMYS